MSFCRIIDNGVDLVRKIKFAQSSLTQRKPGQPSGLRATAS